MNRKKNLKNYLICRLNVEGEWESCKVREEDLEDVTFDSLESGKVLCMFIFKTKRLKKNAEKKQGEKGPKAEVAEPLLFAYLNHNHKGILLEASIVQQEIQELNNSKLEKLLKKQISRRTKIYSEARNLAFLLYTQDERKCMLDEEEHDHEEE